MVHLQADQPDAIGRPSSPAVETDVAAHAGAEPLAVCRVGSPGGHGQGPSPLPAHAPRHELAKQGSAICRCLGTSGQRCLWGWRGAGAVQGDALPAAGHVCAHHSWQIKREGLCMD